MSAAVKHINDLEKSIDVYLNNITKLQRKLEQEEEALQAAMKELRTYETDCEIKFLNSFATA